MNKLADLVSFFWLRIQISRVIQCPRIVALEGIMIMDYKSVAVNTYQELIIIKTGLIFSAFQM